MKTLVIHEVKRSFFELPLHKYRLTFDDALYSQYYYLPLIDTIRTKKVFFVTPSMIGEGEKRDQYDGVDKDWPSCYEAMAKWREEGDNSNYMRLSELWMLEDEIGAHGYHHLKEYGSTLYVQTKTLKDDTDKMIDWFTTNLGVKPSKYSFPHYEEPRFGSQIISQQFSEVFVKNRTPIEK
jgi:hypothetical protein